MKKENIVKYVSLLGIPVLTAVMGLIVLLNPDSAAVLITKLLGWVLIIGGAVKAISDAEQNRHAGLTHWLPLAASILIGILLLKKPLLLAQGIGRFLGILLMIRGGSELKKSRLQGGRILSVATLVIGIVLLVMPMAFTRTIFRLCGMVVLALGLISIAEKLREIKLLEAGSDPNIIDADE